MWRVSTLPVLVPFFFSHSYCVILRQASSKPGSQSTTLLVLSQCSQEFSEKHKKQRNFGFGFVVAFGIGAGFRIGVGVSVGVAVKFELGLNAAVAVGVAVIVHGSSRLVRPLSANGYLFHGKAKNRRGN